MALDTALTSLGEAFTINLVSSNPAARTFGVQLVSPADGLGRDGLSVTDIETSTQIQPG